MPLIKNLTCPNGSFNTFHLCIEVRITGLKTIAVIHSFPDETAYLNRFQPQYSWDIVISNNFLDVPNLATLDKAEVTAISALDTPFGMASHIVRGTIDFRAARERKWAEFKAMRNMLELRSFPWNGKRFDSNLISITRIDSAANNARVALEEGNTQWVANWKLADNTRYALNAAEMQQVQAARYNYVSQLDDATEALYSQLFHASVTTVEQVAAINWAFVAP